MSWPVFLCGFESGTGASSLLHQGPRFGLACINGRLRFYFGELNYYESLKGKPWLGRIGYPCNQSMGTPRVSGNHAAKIISERLECAKQTYFARAITTYSRLRYE